MKKARIRSKHRAGTLGATQADREAMESYLSNLRTQARSTGNAPAGVAPKPKTITDEPK